MEKSKLSRINEKLASIDRELEKLNRWADRADAQGELESLRKLTMKIDKAEKYYEGFQSALRIMGYQVVQFPHNPPVAIEM